MIGQITSYDPETETGTIQIQRSVFAFNLDCWTEDALPQEGDRVFFTQRRNKVLQVALANEVLPKGDPVKSRKIAGFLGVLLGPLGAGRHYLGYYKIGILQLLATLVTLPLFGIGATWGFIDGVLILSGQIMKDGRGRPLK